MTRRRLGKTYGLDGMNRNWQKSTIMDRLDRNGQNGQKRSEILDRSGYK
jgi:hypothetical protein